MDTLIDKLIFFLCGIIILCFTRIDTLSIIAFLISFTLASLNYYFGSYKLYIQIITALFLLLCLISPIFIFFLPVFVYDIYYHEIPIHAIFTACILLISFRFDNNYLSIVLAVSCIIAVLSSHRLKKLNKITIQLKQIRDTSMELQIALEHKNKDLMEKQDYEIHVATLQERNRIAREIHDNVGHMLSRSLLQIGALLATNHNPVLQENLQLLRASLSDAMDSIRKSVHDLHDASIDLYEVIQGIMRDFKNYEIILDYDIKDTIPQDMKYCFITIIKEGFSNIVKHSNATKINLVLREHPAFFQLLLEDNGTNAKNNTKNGIGLENMKDRIQALHGTIQFSSIAGFRIFISLPKNQSSIH